MIVDPAILAAIESMAPKLIVPPEVDARSILAAITLPETEWGERCEAACFEMAYYRGGLWYRALHVRELIHRYEAFASCSYGPWQILFISAWELGYRGHPAELRHPEISSEWVVAYLNKRVHSPTGPRDYFDAWNSGTNADKSIPLGYINRAMEGYLEARKYYGE